MGKSKAIKLTESAMMLAFATILSMIKVVDLPFGGSITAFSMLPIILIAYRYGTSWGLFTALSFSLMQLLLGMKNLSYATNWKAAVAIIILDYIAAFTILGFGGLFRRRFSNQAQALVAGTLFVCALRYVFHVISGCTVWAGVSIPDKDGLIFSLGYNATYLIPETLVTIAGAIYLSRVLDFRSESITRLIPHTKAPDLAILFSGLSKAFIVLPFVFDVAKVFEIIQGEDGFDITKLSALDWPLLALVTAISITLAILFALLAKKVPHNSAVELRHLFNLLPFLGVLAAAVFDIWFIVDSFINDSVSFNKWIQITIITIAVIAATMFVVKRHQAKKQATA